MTVNEIKHEPDIEKLRAECLRLAEFEYAISEGMTYEEYLEEMNESDETEAA